MKPTADQARLLGWLAALGDLARLRVLRLLEREELSVGELARALQLPQSTVSRHLKLLFEDGWVGKRAAGTASLYSLAVNDLPDAARGLWEVARNELSKSRAAEEDDRRLAAVLAQRRTDSRAFFGRIGGEWDELRRQLFGEGFTNEALLALLHPEWIVADLGCGTGDASEQLASVVKRIIAVDREPAMLDAARTRLARFDNIDFREGDLASLPIADGEVDTALVFLVLHHVPDPRRVFAELFRILKPAGEAMIVDMVAHDREEYRRSMGHQHLGFERRQIERWARSAGFPGLRYRRLRPHAAGKGPGLFAAVMSK